MRLPSEAGFKRDWVSTFWEGNRLREGGIKNVTRFREYVKDLCIRRERPEVMSELPLVNRKKLIITMDLQTEKVYDEAVEDFMKWYESQTMALSAMHILGAMQKMRHLVALAKIPATMEYVDEFVEDTDRKLVIFAHHKDVQYLLWDELKNKYDTLELKKKGEDIPVFKLTSEMSGEERFQVQTQFNAAKRAIMIASTLAAGEGLNLQTCADCVMHERQWNPANEEQAEGRFIRIGQTSSFVNAVYAHCEGLTTIDPHLDRIVERKRLQFHATMNNGEAPQWSSDMIAKDLAESIIRAHRAKKGRAA